MSNAKSVHVAMVDPTATPRQSGDEPGADVAAYLARHGIDVTVDALPSAGRSVAQVLQRHANDVAADMIVMGAYGHSRCASSYSVASPDRCSMKLGYPC
ncbi:universal stress protein (plasmid) [Sinorhizobium meliloti]|nr:universal stress protein [Sinorhizobium meliloti]